MKSLCVKLLLLVFLISCKSDISQEMKIDLINNYEFILNGEKFVIQEFDEVFRKENDELMSKNKKKYDIILHVSQGVDMKTVIVVKNQFMLVRDNISELKYSHE